MNKITRQTEWERKQAAPSRRDPLSAQGVKKNEGPFKENKLMRRRNVALPGPLPATALKIRESTLRKYRRAHTQGLNKTLSLRWGMKNTRVSIGNANRSASNLH